MAHYFTDNSNMKSDKHIIEFYYRKHKIRFVGDHGVFSKNKVDYGSRVLLEAIDFREDQKKLLDVGCGYGTIGLSIKTICPWLHVDMVDVNDRAISLAKEAIELNNLKNVRVFKSNAYENVEGEYDVVVSNPPIRAGKQVVFDILGNAYNHLKLGGELYIVIQKKQGAPSAKKKLEEVFGNCEIITKDKGYYILKSIK